MQTAFTSEQLAKPHISAADGILKDCVHYGFCTAVCPTYVLLRDENDAPRGRIDLIREMLETGGEPSPRTVGYIDRCLSCNACMTTCAAKVDYMHLVDIARAYIERHYRRPFGDRLLRRLIAFSVSTPSRFRLAVKAAALWAPFRHALPSRLGNLIDMAYRVPASRESGTASGVYPPEGKPRARVALLAGCVQEAVAPHLNGAAIRLLTRHGCEVVVAQGCCGALALHMGRERSAKEAARQCVSAWSREIETGGLDAIVASAAGCGATVKDYGRIFARDADEAEKAREIAARARDVTEVLHGIGLRPLQGGLPIKIAYHDACSLQHTQKVFLQPRELLRAAGFSVVDVPERHFCCGSAGAYNMLQPKIARELGRRKAGRIEETGAAAVAAGNLGCMTQIGFFTELPIVHTVELLDWATGGPMPRALEGRELTADESGDPSAAPAVW